jgi:hypothetical protein
MNIDVDNRPSIIRSALLFFLSYAFGVVLHCMIHEFGHAITIWIQGGIMTGFYFHPFDGCLNSSTYVPNHILLYAGGAFFGLPLTIIFMIVALKKKSPVIFPLIVAGTFGFLSSGIWMLRSLSRPDIFTDYSSMVKLGVPEFVMLLAGIIYISFGLLARIFFLPLAGITKETNYPTRFSVYLLGVIPWYLLLGVFNIIFRQYAFVSLVSLLIPVILYTLFEALISLPLQKKVWLFKYMPYRTVTKKHLIVICIGIILLYTVMIGVDILFPIKT